MKINNQIITGFYEYHPDLTFTASDLVLYIDINQSRIFRVKAEVRGVNPILDYSETYFEDYFKKVYGESDLLTKSNIQTYLNSMIAGLGTNVDGELDSLIIPESELTYINKTCVFTTGGNNGFCVVNSQFGFMLIHGPNVSYYRVGNKEGNHINWGGIINIGTNLNALISIELNKISEMKTILANKIQEYTDKIEAIS